MKSTGSGSCSTRPTARGAVVGTISSAQGATASVSSPFAARAAGAAVRTEVHGLDAGEDEQSPRRKPVREDRAGSGQANIDKVDVEMPKALPSRLKTLKQACTEAQFTANPAGCPAASDHRHGDRGTPLLNAPLTGRRSSSPTATRRSRMSSSCCRAKGSEIVLDGKTQIKQGVTYSQIRNGPRRADQLVRNEAARGPALGSHGEHPGSTNLCATTTTKTVTVTERVTKRVHGRRRRVTVKVKKTVTVSAPALAMPTTITAQNGAVVTQSTKIAATGCAKVKQAVPTRAQKLAAALKTCRKQVKGKRAGCEKRARKQYAPTKAGARKKHNKQHN